MGFLKLRGQGGCWVDELGTLREIKGIGLAEDVDLRSLAVHRVDAINLPGSVKETVHYQKLADSHKNASDQGLIPHQIVSSYHLSLP